MNSKQKREVYKYCKIFNDYRTKRLILKYKVAHFYSTSITRYIGQGGYTYIGVNICLVIRGVRQQHNVCDVKWHNVMYEWNYDDWVLFLAILLKRMELSSISSILVTYKIRKSEEKQYEQILQSHFKQLLSNTKFGSYWKHCPRFNHDETIRQDMAFYFDASSLVIKILYSRTGIKMEDRTKCPAFTYYLHTKYVVLDCNNKKYNTQREYMKFRLKSAYNLHTKKMYLTKRQKKYAKHEMIFLRKLIEIQIPRYSPDSPDSQQDTVIDFCTAMEEHEKYVVPKRIRKLFKQYGMKCDDSLYRKKCEVCSKMERINLEETYEIYVDKIYVCKCKRLYVCSRKCQKYAWKQKGHRHHCAAKLLK
eukprot:303542_1